MLTKNMLGDNETLRKFFSGPLYTLWVGYIYSKAEVVNLGVVNTVNEFRRFLNGPLLDFMIKVNSNPEKWEAQFNLFLRGDLTLVNLLSNIAVWKTVRLGTYREVGFLLAAVKNQGWKFMGSTENTLRKYVELSQFETKIDLVNVSTAELGFTKPYPTHQEVYDKACQFGLEPCPNEILLQLPLQYSEIPKDECLHVIVVKKQTSSDCKTEFTICNHVDGGCYISDCATDFTRSTSQFTDRWLFKLPRKNSLTA